MNENAKMTEMEKFLEEAEIIRGALIDYFDGLQDSLQKIFTCECEEPLLTEKEHSYLFSIIKPFRDKVIYIEKSSSTDQKSFIRIGIEGDTEILLPLFPNNKMYSGMETNELYSPEELGL